MRNLADREAAKRAGVTGEAITRDQQQNCEYCKFLHYEPVATAANADIIADIITFTNPFTSTPFVVITVVVQEFADATKGAICGSCITPAASTVGTAQLPSRRENTVGENTFAPLKVAIDLPFDNVAVVQPKKNRVRIKKCFLNVILLRRILIKMVNCSKYAEQSRGEHLVVVRNR